MFQRPILRSSRAVSSRLSSRTPTPSFRPQSPFVRLSASQPPRIASRWYSDAAEAKKEGAPKEGEKSAGDPTDKSDAQPGNEVDKLKKELEAKNREIVDLKDKYLRAVAEQRNIQNRADRSVQQAKDFALQRFAKDLIESIDNLDRALSTVPSEKLHGEGHNVSAEDTHKDLINLHDGLRMTETILMQTLRKHGLERFDPAVEGLHFDPNVHEAVFQAPQPDKKHGTVFHTQQKGFMLNGRVIRPAKVGVVKNE